MKPTEIQDLIKFVAKSGVSEVEIEDKDFKITIKTPPHIKGKIIETTPQVVQVQAPVSTSATPVQETPKAQAEPVAAPPVAAASEDDSKYVAIKSPMIGTFYRKPSPDKPNFVSVGDDVTNDSVVCIIEAMKLFNEIEAEVTGKIVKMLVDDGSPVEYDQPLYLVDPA
ncbi:MAG: acetyl-CoA carboxylase biotin carboxyl carrier protein [Vicingus serpentipes]|nr:acetyl-CoA carboxylase biotin carboxyl carrier protein [Vicingus serpentipes]